jgi:hypothetical protein
MNPTTLRKATQLMRTEMGLTMQGYDAAKQHISTSLGGGASQPSTPTDTSKSVTSTELAAIAKKRGTTVDQERARATAAGYVVR